MIVDAHHHLWDPRLRRHAWLDTLPQLRRPFGSSEFAQLAAEHSVTASVLVQVLASTEETEEFLALAAAGPLVAGVIGWADLTALDVADQIARLRQLPGGARLVGIRHLVQDEPDPYANRLLDCFGPGRLMFGSDWPVCTLAAGYGDVLQLATAVLAARLGPADSDAVLAGNAARIYRLGLAR
ncbi:MAG TPA: amidohydrolase family protein [Streptosporangiaceae bacterium]|nr:amidohydrolase family protein [Streptosporangiaceae bacterium]